MCCENGNNVSCDKANYPVINAPDRATTSASSPTTLISAARALEVSVERVESAATAANAHSSWCLLLVLDELMMDIDRGRELWYPDR